MKNNIKAKDAKVIIKEAMDRLAMELVEELGTDVLKYNTLKELLRNEMVDAITDIANNGAVRTEGERWGR